MSMEVVILRDRPQDSDQKGWVEGVNSERWENTAQGRRSGVISRCLLQMNVLWVCEHPPCRPQPQVWSPPTQCSPLGLLVAISCPKTQFLLTIWNRMLAQKGDMLCGWRGHHQITTKTAPTGDWRGAGFRLL